MKVGKEEMIGCLTAIETWLKLDEKKLYREWNDRVDSIRKLVETVPGVKTEIYIPDDGNRFPTLKVSWDQQAWGFTIADCVQALREGDPVIEVLGADNPSLVTAVREGKPNPTRKERPEADHIELVSMTIQPGEEVDCGTTIAQHSGRGAKRKAGSLGSRLSAPPCFRYFKEGSMRLFLVGLLAVLELSAYKRRRAPSVLRSNLGCTSIVPVPPAWMRETTSISPLKGLAVRMVRCRQLLQGRPAGSRQFESGCRELRD